MEPYMSGTCLFMPSFIDPEYWQRKFLDYVADVEFIKMVCNEASI